MKKKLIIPVLIATMLGTSIPAYGANFYDINDVPWEGAKTYINQVADLGLMVGSNDSAGRKVFKAKSNLTYLECSQLVYALFGKDKAVTAYTDTIGTKWSTVLKGYKITDWAHPAVSFCLENGILSISEVSKFMSGTTAKNAPRQDVAVMFGKAFEKAGFTQKQSFSFNDASKIASAALQYANLLGSLNILTGDNNKNFNPTNLINRAEMAVIVSKTYDTLGGKGAGTTTGTTGTTSGTGQITGVVSSVVTYGDQYVLTMLSSEGQKSFMMSSSTKVNYNNKVYGPEEIGESDTITVLYTGTTVVSVVVTNDANDDIGGTSSSTTTNKEETAKETYSGIIYSMNEDRMVVQKSGSNRETFEGFDDDDVDVEVIIDGRSRSYSRLLSEYDDRTRKDDINVVVYINDNDEVFKIVATVDGGEADGIIKSVTTKKIEIGKEDYYLNTDVLTIKVNGVEITLNKLIDLVEKYNDFDAKAALDGEEQVISLIITSNKYEGEGISGEVDDVYDTYIKIDGRFYDYPSDLTKIYRIKLNGRTVTTEELKDAFENLGRDDTMTAEVKLKNNYVDEIIAETDVETEEVTGVITYIGMRSIEIDEAEYDIDEDKVDVRILNGNSNITKYEDLVNLYDISDKTKIEVEAIVIDDEVTEMTGSLVSFEDVRVYSVDSSKGTINIGTSRESHTYDVKTNCTIKIGGRASDLDDLKNDVRDYRMYADVEFNSRGEVVEIIAVKD